MFSRKFFAACVFLLLLVMTLVSLLLSGRHSGSVPVVGRGVLAFMGPLQQGASWGVRAMVSVWEVYFDCVAQARENRELRNALRLAAERENHFLELGMANERLRTFLNFREEEAFGVLAAEIVGKDPSPWFKTFVVNRGRQDGVSVGLAVVVPEGIVGQVVEVSGRYAKIQLITDRMSGVDALVQRTRARGVVNGSGSSFCAFSYALRRYDIAEGDVVVSSGLDRVYPKGLRIGLVEDVVRGHEGIFQDVHIRPFVDFERIEEVLILLSQDEDTEAGVEEGD